MPPSHFREGLSVDDIGSHLDQDTKKVPKLQSSGKGNDTQKYFPGGSAVRDARNNKDRSGKGDCGIKNQKIEAPTKRSCGQDGDR
jgi:hypothetical protein